MFFIFIPEPCKCTKACSKMGGHLEEEVSYAYPFSLEVSIFTLLSLLLFLGYATSSDLALLACLTVAVHGYMAMAWACGAWRCWRRELDRRG